jgi:hypothetical protein
VTEQSLQALVPRQTQCDQGTQTTEQTRPITEQLEIASPQISETIAPQSPVENVTSPTCMDNRIEKWIEAPEDTAAWLYRLVFHDSQIIKRDKRTSIEKLSLPSMPDLLVSTNRASKAPLVDRLLQQWTTLRPIEIEATSCAVRDDSAQLYMRDVERRVQRLSGRHSMPELSPASSRTQPAKRLDPQHGSMAPWHQTNGIGTRNVDESLRPLHSPSHKRAQTARPALIQSGNTSRGHIPEWRQYRSAPSATLSGPPHEHIMPTANPYGNLPYIMTPERHTSKPRETRARSDVRANASMSRPFDQRLYRGLNDGSPADHQSKPDANETPAHQRKLSGVTDRRRNFQATVEDDVSEEFWEKLWDDTESSESVRSGYASTVEGEDWVEERKILLQEMKRRDRSQPWWGGAEGG